MQVRLCERVNIHEIQYFELCVHACGVEEHELSDLIYAVESGKNLIEFSID